MTITCFYDRKDIFGNRTFCEDSTDSESVYNFDLKKMLQFVFKQVRKHDYSGYEFRLDFAGKFSMNITTKHGDEENDVYTVDFWSRDDGRDEMRKMSKKALSVWIENLYNLDLEHTSEKSA